MESVLVFLSLPLDVERVSGSGGGFPHQLRLTADLLTSDTQSYMCVCVLDTGSLQGPKWLSVEKGHIAGRSTGTDPE